MQIRHNWKIYSRNDTSVEFSTTLATCPLSAKYNCWFYYVSGSAHCTVHSAAEMCESGCASLYTIFYLKFMLNKVYGPADKMKSMCIRKGFIFHFRMYYSWRRRRTNNNDVTLSVILFDRYTKTFAARHLSIYNHQCAHCKCRSMMPVCCRKFMCVQRIYECHKDTMINDAYPHIDIIALFGRNLFLWICVWWRNVTGDPSRCEWFVNKWNGLYSKGH